MAAPAGYRPCVGILLLDRQGRIFIGERRGPALDAWQMPQGGIDDGETPLAAARRELLEEVGTDQAELLAESARWHCYDVPPALRPEHWRGRWQGQCQRWFAFRFTGADAAIDIATAEPEFARWRWASAAELLAVIVPFKRAVYEAVLAEFGHLLTPAAPDRPA
jgi:putative (di)nucleoside polyphosphate hydrolase